MATIDKDLLLDKIDRLLKLHSYAREDWFANTIHNTVWDAPEIETGGETIYRADAIETVRNVSRDLIQDKCMPLGCATDFTDALSALPSADAVQGWIPCSERLPEDIGPVLVTWKNNDPASYYQYIVGKHFIGTAHYHRGKENWCGVRIASGTEQRIAKYKNRSMALKILTSAPTANAKAVRMNDSNRR